MRAATSVSFAPIPVPAALLLSSVIGTGVSPLMLICSVLAVLLGSASRSVSPNALLVRLPPLTARDFGRFGLVVATAVLDEPVAPLELPLDAPPPPPAPFRL